MKSFSIELFLKIRNVRWAPINKKSGWLYSSFFSIQGLSILLLVSIFLLSCRKQEMPGENFLSLDKTNIRFDSLTGTSEDITVHSSVPWTAVISPNATTWLQLDKTSGGPGNTIVKLSNIRNNGTITPQTGTVTFSPANGNTPQPVILTVTQKSYSFRIGFSKIFGGGDYESAHLVECPDGGFILAGYTSSTDGDVHGSHGKEDVWIIKLNGAGDTLWTRTLGGTGDDNASAISVTPDGGYIVVGTTDSDDGDVTDKRPDFKTDVWVIKLDESGHTTWSRTFGGSENDVGRSVLVTPDGGYLLAGGAGSNDGDVAGNHGGGDVWVIKIDGLGNRQWSKTYGGSNWDEASRIIATSNGYVVAGLTNSNDGDVTGYHIPTFIGSDMLVMKIDLSGNKIWAKAFGGTNDELVTSIAAAPDGYVLAGYTDSNDGDITGYHGTNTLFYDMWVLKLNEAGNIVWAKAFGGTFDDAATSVTATPDGGFVVGGAASSNDGDVTGSHNNRDGNNDFWIVKLDTDGNKQWARALGGSGDDAAFSISVKADQYTIAGITSSTDGDVIGNHRGLDDLWVTRLIVQ